MTDSNDGLDYWKNRLYELHGHQCARITKSLRWLGSHIRTLPFFDGSIDPEEFIVQFLEQVLDSQKMENLDLAFGVTIARRWTTHKKYLPSWETGPTSLRLRFGDQLQRAHSRFNGQSRPQEHLEHCYGAWKLVPRTEWVPRFVHIQAIVGLSTLTCLVIKK